MLLSAAVAAQENRKTCCRTSGGSFCAPPCRGGRYGPPDVSGWNRRCRFCGDTATVSPTAYFFCCARAPTLRRGRWRAQPSATKERYGCGPPLAGAHRPDCPVSPELPLMRQHRNRVSGGSSSQTPHSSPRRRRQVSSVPLLVLSKLQTLRWFAIWFHLSCQKK